MERKILLLGDERLYRICAPVEFAQLERMPGLMADMRDTILAYRRRMGAGRAIAAPQIGVFLRVICVRAGEEELLINPSLEFVGEEMMDVLDDCMSFPHLLVRLRRHRRCRVRYRDLQWRERVRDLEGDMAELLQHECDHLDGVLATMRARDARDLVMLAH